MKESKIVSGDPEVMSGAFVFWGTRVEVKALVDCLRAVRTLDDFPKGFPSASPASYMETTPEADR